MMRIRKKWLAVILGGALAIGALTGCGGGSSGGSSSGSPTKVADAITFDIGGTKGSLQELTIPGQKKLASPSLTGAGNKLYLLVDPVGGDKAVLAYDVDGAKAAPDKKFGKDGKLTEPKGLIGYANNISANSEGNLFIAHQSDVSVYKDGKVDDLLKNAMSNCRVVVPEAPLPTMLVWTDAHVKMAIIIEGQIPPDGLEEMPAAMTSYKKFSYAAISSGADPHVYVAGELDNKLNTIINVDSKLQYGNPTDKKAPDGFSWTIRMFAVTGKYVVSYDSGDNLRIWSLDGKYIGRKELKKIFPPQKEKDFDYTCKSMCAVGDTIYMAIEGGTFGEDKDTKVYSLKLG